MKKLILSVMSSLLILFMAACANARSLDHPSKEQIVKGAKQYVESTNMYAVVSVAWAGYTPIPNPSMGGPMRTDCLLEIKDKGGNDAFMLITMWYAYDNAKSVWYGTGQGSWGRGEYCLDPGETKLHAIKDIKKQTLLSNRSMKFF